MKTVKEYRAFKSVLRDKIIAAASKIPNHKINEATMKIAIELNMNPASVKAYFAGTGTNFETALAVNEKILELGNGFMK